MVSGLGDSTSYSFLDAIGTDDFSIGSDFGLATPSPSPGVENDATASIMNSTGLPSTSVVNSLLGPDMDNIDYAPNPTLVHQLVKEGMRVG